MPEEETGPIQPGEGKELAADAEDFLKRTDNARLGRELNEGVGSLAGLVDAAYARMKPEIYQVWLERKDSAEHQKVVDAVYRAQGEVSRKTGGAEKPEHFFPANPYTPAELLLRAAIAVLENPIDVANDPLWEDKVEDRGQQKYFLAKVRTALNTLGYDVVTAETGALIEDALKRGDDEVTIKIPKDAGYFGPL